MHSCMLLSDLISASPLTALHPLTEATEAEISDLTLDSRTVQEGSLFIALKGSASDGHDYIPQAIAAGAKAILLQEYQEGIPAEVVVLKSPAVRQATSQLAAVFHGHPSDQLAVLGVTGTNGKTTTAFLIDSLMRAKFGRNGLIGTVYNDEGYGPVATTHTTPESIDLQASLARMVRNGCLGVAIEISSHGIEQGRTADLSVNAAVFTNLTQDHLDYHGTMENYYQAKKALFTQLGEQSAETNPTAIINVDDYYGVRLSEELAKEYPKLRQITFGLGVNADMQATDLRQTANGTEFRVDFRNTSYLVKSPMIGLFNARNILCALASVVAPKLMNMREAVAAIAKARQVPGRLERISGSNAQHVFVDYAHTPDALANVCQTLKELADGRLITVFGCGGDRDTSKRPLMAEAASLNSNICIITSDNPRTENPITIIKEVEAGIVGGNSLSIVDRKKAIEHAIDLARDGDIVLVAGKGHEDYQIFGTEKTPFDDRKICRDTITHKQKPPMES